MVNRIRFGLDPGDGLRPLLVSVEMTVQLWRAGRLRGRSGIEIHHRDGPYLGLGPQGSRVVRVTAAVEEDQQACPGPDYRTIPFHRRDAVSVLIVGENELTASVPRVISEKEKTG